MNDMEVYIVWFVNFNGDDEFCGAFSCEEKASEFIARHSDKKQMRFDMYVMDE